MMRSSARSPWSLTRKAPPDSALLREKYLTSLLAYAQRRLGNRDDAEDAVAEVFGVAYNNLNRCPAPEWERAWLFGIARNKVADTLRKRQKRAEIPLDAVAEHTATLPDTALHLFLETLRPEWREVLLLKYVEGLSLAEIGRMLGKSEKAVSSMLQRARAAAQEALTSEDTL